MKNVRIILLVTVLLICIIAVGVAIYFQMTENDYKEAVNKSNSSSSEDEIATLMTNFESIFKNDITGSYENINKQKETKEIVYLAAERVEVIPNQYDLDVQIPQININNDNIKSYNKDIQILFQNKAANILSNAQEYTIYNVKYHANIEQNILSLVIRANLKEGLNPEREIIKTYNINLETNELLDMQDIIDYKSLDKNTVQDKIKEEMNNKKDYEKSLSQLGYETYNRDLDNQMYNVENVTNFFIGEQGKVYIIYAYGNKNYTSELDLVII